jgi:hypothetical protein
MEKPSPENNTRIEKLKPKGIIAGNPGIGKTTLVKNYAKQFNIVDFDSEPYRKDPNWPNNYLDLVEEKAAGESLLLISSYPEVVKELTTRGYEVTVVCADESLESEYRDKYKDRGNSQEMVDKFIASAFTSNEEQLKRFEGSKVVFLQTGQHLSDIIDLD